MLFSSTVFIFMFLPAVLFGYYVLFRNKRKMQNIFLFLASLLFYAWGEPFFVLLMLASICCNWFFALKISAEQKCGICNRAKKWVVIMLFSNLGIMFIFKYFTFVLNTINSVTGANVPIPNIILPIGISFFTFQAISYVIDVYRGNGIVQKNIINVGLYISFFPQLIAGPIVRYQTVAEQIEHRTESFDDFSTGVIRFILGLGKKVLLANTLALVADRAFNMAGELSVGMAWLGAIAYTLQIFFDFSGYSDMAIGLGRMFGFHFLDNFNYPYISKSISEFWRRWHISLGTWFRDYVYFPMGGSRVKDKKRLLLNLFIVWILTGIWHGANWTFICWGLFYFVLIAIEKICGHEKKKKQLSILRHIYVLFFVVLGWVLFRAENLSQAVLYWANMFGSSGTFLDNYFYYSLKEYIYYFIAATIFCLPIGKVLLMYSKKNIILKIFVGILLVGIFLVSVVYMVKGTYNPFIYFNF